MLEYERGFDCLSLERRSSESFVYTPTRISLSVPCACFSDEILEVAESLIEVLFYGKGIQR